MSKESRRSCELGLLVMVDVGQLAGGAEFKFDDWGIDIAITSSQKCLMSSPGLSFVAVSDPRVETVRIVSVSEIIFQFPTIRKNSESRKSRTPGTTPVHLVMQINEALSMIHEERSRQCISSAPDDCRKMVHDWIRENECSLQCPDLQQFSPTVTAIRFQNVFLSTMSDWLCARKGILIARGIDQFEDKSVRIGHMGDIRAVRCRDDAQLLTEIITPTR